MPELECWRKGKRLAVERQHVQVLCMESIYSEIMQISVHVDFGSSADTESDGFDFGRSAYIFTGKIDFGKSI